MVCLLVGTLGNVRTSDSDKGPVRFAEPHRILGAAKKDRGSGPTWRNLMSVSETFTDHVVAVYPSHGQAEEAVKQLSTAGFNMRNLSIVGQNYESVEQPIGFVNSGDRMLTWGKFGAFWGSIWGLLFGSAMLFVPGVGFVMFAGWIVAALEGAVVGGGLAALGGAFASIGVPDKSIVRYESELKAGNFLLLAHGTQAEVDRAMSSLSSTQATHIKGYSNKSPAPSATV